MTYQVTEMGRREAYIRPFPASADKYQIHTGGADVHPLWSRDGKELLFSTGPTTFAAVSVTTQPSFTFGRPESIPRGGLMGTNTGPRTYDVLPDGRFLGVVAAGLAPQIHVVLNWFDDLKQRVPVR